MERTDRDAVEDDGPVALLEVVAALGPVVVPVGVPERQLRGRARTKLPSDQNRRSSDGSSPTCVIRPRALALRRAVRTIAAEFVARPVTT